MRRSDIALDFARLDVHDLSVLFGTFFGSNGPGRSDGHVSLPAHLAGTTSFAAIASARSGASVSTDLDDYAPGSTATITASGFDDGATVTFEVDHVDGAGDDGVYGTADDEVVQLGGAGHDPWTVTDGGEGDADGEANGTIVTTWHVDADDSLGERFLLTASDGTNTATNTFTDSVPDDASVNLVAPVDFDPTAPNPDLFVNGAIFTNDASAAGTGLINSFVRISTNDPTEEGYNTSDRPLQFDENSSPQFTRDLFFGDIPQVTIDGITYLEFQLDINEPNTDVAKFLSLDVIQIYLSDTQVDTGGSFPANLGTLVYDLDAGLAEGEDNWIALNYGLQAGSGVNDMVMYVPLSAFDGADEDTFVTLYSEFGLQGTDGTFDWTNNSGFEEWDVRQFASIRGIKYEDEFGNLIKDGSDPVLEGWEIRAYVDLNKDGNLDTAEYNAGPVGTDITDENGAYRLDFFNDAVLMDDTVIENAQYLIVEVLQDGWTQVFPAGDNILDPTLNSGTETFGEKGFVFNPGSGDFGNPITDQNFGNFELFDIRGIKFEDLNGNGVFDVGESAPAITFTIRLDIWADDGDGIVEINELTLVNQIETDPTDGSWEFNDLDALPDTLKYVVRELGEAGWVQTTPDPTSNLGAIIIPQEESGVDVEFLEFGNFELFDLSGTKFTDANGDGSTAGDVGLAGVTIFIDENDDGDFDAGEMSTTTDANGDWSFNNLGVGFAGLDVYEILPDGHVQTLGQAGYEITGTSGADQTGLDFANFELFDISGTKFTDANGDGSTAGDVGLAGVTIFIDENDDGDFDAGEMSTTTDANGDWSFNNLGVGFAGLDVYEILPDGHVQTLGQAGYEITGTSGADQTGLDFANFELFDLSGTKFTDANGDGSTAGDVGLAGVTIFIDENDDGDFDAGEMSTTTDANGDWSFNNLGVGFAGLDVYEILPDGHVQTLGQAGYEITGTSGADQTGLDFANFELFDISGTKFTDANGDGSTAGDVGLAGVTIFIDENDDGDFDAGEMSTTTDANGDWSFNNLGVGFAGLDVYEILPDGHVQTLGQAGYEITGTSGADQTGLDFANFELFDLSGTKFTDANGDGSTAGDVGLAGVTIFIDENDDGDFDAGEMSTTTDANGDWSFNNLGVGFAGLDVYEILPDGHVQTLGQAGYEITGTSGADQTGLDFANFELFDISGTKFTDANGDGSTAGDVGLAGVTIFIDENDDGDFDAGEMSTTTDANGDWSFNNLGVGFAGLDVYEILPDGHVQTLGQAGYEITGTSGADQTGLDFANFELFDLSGTKFTDANGDGSTAGDVGLAGVTIFIDENDDGDFDAGEMSTTTDANGDWSFNNLGVGFAGLDVYEILPDGHVQTLGQAGYEITGTSGADQTGLDFANFELFDISGTKYDDLDGDGIVDAGEPGLAGVTIFIDENDDGDFDAGEMSTTTDANGDWSFNNLGVGFAGLKVFEIVPDGHVQTLGQAGYEITGTSGADQTGLDFANHVPSDPGSAMTPGFWRNHLDIFDQEIAGTGFDQNSEYEVVFGVELKFDGVGGKNEKYPTDPTLAEALAAMGGGEGALLRASTSAYANSTSDDLNYSYLDADTFNFAVSQTTGLDPDSLDPDEVAAFFAARGEILDILVKIDEDGNGTIENDEVINAVQDVYDKQPNTLLMTDDFDFGDIDEVAGALDTMNNMPHIDANDFMV